MQPPAANPSTIYALSSGHGRAGVAVIRISGPAAGPILDAMAAPRPKPRFAAFRRIRHPETSDLLDEALVLFFPGPRSETGEDMAELQVHGSGAVIRAVFAALATFPSCRLAEPGEFARRAFENGRLDLTAAEGLADLVDAETEAQRKQALAQAGGALARLYETWREDLLASLALLEAGIDFSDEPDVASDAVNQALIRAATLRTQIATHLSDGHRGEIIREGFRVVLAGPPNAGKSSLLNVLAQRDVAIVSAEPGTTRDVIEVRLDLGGYPVLLTDTAGVRETAAEVEREGIRRTWGRVREADLVLWVTDATAVAAPRPDELAGASVPVIVVHNKMDLVAGGSQRGTPDPAVQVSARTGQGLDGLVAAISGEVAKRLGAGGSVVLSQARHRAGLEACMAALERLAAGDPSEAELRAEELRQAADALGRIVGRVDPEEVLGIIFGRFCIGK